MQKSRLKSPLFNPPYAFHAYCGNAKYTVQHLQATTFQQNNGPLTLLSDLRTGIPIRSRIVDSFVGYYFMKDLED